MNKQKKPSLRQQLKDALTQIESYRSGVQDLRLKLNEIKSETGLQSYADDKEILKVIQRLLEYRRSTEGARDVTLSHLYEENARLWHMVRSMTGDETLLSSKKADPTRLNGQCDTFNQPHF